MMTDNLQIMMLLLKIICFGFPVVIVALALHTLITGAYLASFLWALILAFNYWLYRAYLGDS